VTSRTKRASRQGPSYAGGGWVTIHLIVGLNEGAVSRWLATERALRSPELPETGGRELFGFLYCAGARAFVFVDPSYGEACARFTLAHELGHLFLEYRPLFDRSATQGNLFAMPPPANFFRRDGADTLARAIDSGSASAADVLLAEKNAPPARLNEVIANAFAAELLAPVDEVQRTVSGAIGLDAYVERVEKKFGLSRRAATIRVLEIFGSSPGRQRSLEGV
jgi:hypothetical protein